MKPTTTLAETSLPGGSQLVLIEHDGAYFLQADGIQLQSSLTSNGAEQLARLACAPFRPVRQPRLLLAGLGLGFTLAAAREELPQKRGVFEVAEPLRDLPGWHREFLSELHPGLLDDPRLVVRAQTLRDLCGKPGEGYHAILIDAEGAPGLEAVTDRQGLLHSSFLHRAHSALKEGGLLAVCTPGDPRSFERRLRQAGFDVARESVPTSHKGKQKRRSTIWLARKGTYYPKKSRRPQS